MSKTIEAVYEKGVFRPLEPVMLPEGERVGRVLKLLVVWIRLANQTHSDSQRGRSRYRA